MGASVENRLFGENKTKFRNKNMTSCWWLADSLFLSKLQVRDQTSGEVLLYHSDDCMPSVPGTTQVIGRSLTEELNSNYRLAIVRRLRTPLSPQKVALVHDFVALNNGSIIPEQCRPSSILMASSSSPTQSFERLDCSEFVTMMLHLVGLVEPTQNPFEYVSTDSKGRLLAPPISIKLKSPSSSSNATTTTTTSTANTISATTTTTGTTTSSTQSEQHHVYNRQFSELSLDNLQILVSTSKNDANGDHSYDSSTSLATSPTSVVVHSQRQILLSSGGGGGGDQGRNAPATPTKNNREMQTAPPPPSLGTYGWW
jgi:hypothetical protein